MQRSAKWRSRRDFSNEYFLAKFGFDTAENEPSKVCRIPWQLSRGSGGAARAALANSVRFAAAQPLSATWIELPWPYSRLQKCIFEKMHFSKMHFSKICKFLAGSFSAVSKRNVARKYAFDSIFQALQDLHPFAPLQSQNFRKKIGLKKQQFSWNFSKKIANVANFAKFCQISKISAWKSGRFWKML